jgi:histidine phosphotransferase ChpT
VARDFVQGGKHTLSWQGPPVTLPKNKVKLLLNLLALGVVALPRGGTVNVEIKGEGPQVAFRVLAQGEPARLSEQVTGLLAGANGMVLDAHSIQPYYAGRVATAAGMTVTVETRDKEVELTAA